MKCLCGSENFERMDSYVMGDKVSSNMCKDCGKVYPIEPTTIETEQFSKQYMFDGTCTKCEGRKCTVKIFSEGMFGDAAKLLKQKEDAIRGFFNCCEKRKEKK